MDKVLRTREWIMLMIIFTLLAGFMGYTAGFTAGLNWSIEKAFWLLEIKGYEVDINLPLIQTGIQMYKSHAEFQNLLPDLNGSDLR